ncbi:hypothetical protein B0H63DRAFT_84907 [Podospora didyma]|uniref:Uncharacterized protein n=1 Tax=Podospora didyma TaxID=330526 RepID=A0AAE0N1V4_9PEZI|nr:hypothetical protein B0H63DRAFT_84907 [Podospora didyma]
MAGGIAEPRGTMQVLNTPRQTNNTHPSTMTMSRENPILSWTRMISACKIHGCRPPRHPSQQQPTARRPCCSTTPAPVQMLLLEQPLRMDQYIVIRLAMRLTTYLSALRGAKGRRNSGRTKINGPPGLFSLRRRSRLLKSPRGLTRSASRTLRPSQRALDALEEIGLPSDLSAGNSGERGCGGMLT